MNYAAVILILAVFRVFFAWVFPDTLYPYIWNISGSVSILALLYLFAWDKKSLLVIPFVAWWTYEECLVIFGTVIRLTIFKDAPASREQVSSLINLPLGLLSVAICAAFAVMIYKENKRAANSRP